MRFLSLLVALLALTAGCATTHPPPSYDVADDAKGMDDAQLRARVPKADLSADAAIARQKELVAAIPVDFDEPITVIRSVMPAYPDSAMADGVTGIVRLRFVVDEGGHVGAIDVLESPDQRLSNACIAAVRQWQYKPLTRNHVPTTALFNQTFPFRL